MGEYEENLIIETKYLEQTLAVVKNKLEEKQDQIAEKKEKLLASRRDMYENTSHSSNDFDKLSEMVQHLNSLEVQTYDYEATVKLIEKCMKQLKSPYFARIDFIEDGTDKKNVYIGVGSLTDDKTYNTYVYDWRAPISSIFYRYELGEVSYLAPCGTVKGEVTLKRQYEIKNGKLQYFFDSSVNVMDDMLKKALSGNASSKMKIIVETIQREQDIIIRDIENDVVIVQGVSGSGKTSVALHRVAFLMYQGLTEKLERNNIILISPNLLFGQYISNVLPELGEENIATLTFEDIFATIFDGKYDLISRNSLLEEIITSGNSKKKYLLKSSLEFKLSKTFLTIFERFLRHFERRMIEFSDIHFNGESVADRHLLKADLLNRQKRIIPLEKRLNQIETRIMNRLQELRKDRLKKLEKFVSEQTAHPLDAKAFARMLVAKQSAALRKTIYKFTKIDYLSVYKILFKDKALFYRLSKGIDLPPDMEQILDQTNKNLSADKLRYEDAILLMCLKIKMNGSSTFTDIKQVVVDEAQDYYPMHFEILKILFPNAKYTIVGDINQTIEKRADLSIYDHIKSILNKQKTTTVFMSKSFRSSFEINTFSAKFIDSNIAIESIDRHGSAPEIVRKSSKDELDDALIRDIRQCQDSGYSSIAIICKSLKQAKELYSRINCRITVELINEDTDGSMAEVLIIPVHMAKGLEFDAVLVYSTDEKNYMNADDKRLMYIACTRALHKLSLYYTGNISKFL
ncbi:MAG: AAA family ATPase [Bacillota bacterium]|nr:AAA family ATPase [Bacillota bacterium]